MAVDAALVIPWLSVERGVLADVCKKNAAHAY
jgi:hypothetical protein